MTTTAVQRGPTASGGEGEAIAVGLQIRLWPWLRLRLLGRHNGLYYTIVRWVSAYWRWRAYSLRRRWDIGVVAGSTMRCVCKDAAQAEFTCSLGDSASCRSDVCEASPSGRPVNASPRRTANHAAEDMRATDPNDTLWIPSQGVLYLQQHNANITFGRGEAMTTSQTDLSTHGTHHGWPHWRSRRTAQHDSGSHMAADLFLHSGCRMWTLREPLFVLGSHSVLYRMCTLFEGQVWWQAMASIAHIMLPPLQLQVHRTTLCPKTASILCSKDFSILCSKNLSSSRSRACGAVASGHVWHGRVSK